MARVEIIEGSLQTYLIRERADALPHVIDWVISMFGAPASDHNLWGLLSSLFDYLVQHLPSSIVAAVVVIAIFTVLTTLVIGAIGALLEALAKLVDTIQSTVLGLFTKHSRIKSRRRGQFCSALDADLAYIAKSENWNDQYFTDLEAEVETEGTYYASTLSRLLRRGSRGLRRVSSLIKAIESSPEPHILLVGEPGSGKSVALRHVAKQLANRTMRSKREDAPIPLYLNLRELSPIVGELLDADLIKRFVLDNIRRGDSDTADYVRNNWDDFRDEGSWFFLFDSFDEIPDVLHAAMGSPTIDNYASAIRQFLAGMGKCRGIVASREFKGPDTMPWPKFRILPLSEAQQSELVENSFLDTPHIAMVRQHLAMTKSALKTNPLFLSLLCRYAREVGRAPVNDHDLLSGHIDRLARREPDYIKRTYGLQPNDLIKGAEILAAAFAECNLSLAPTQDEILKVIDERQIPGGSLSNLTAALIDVKVARSDVPHARPGDRRFMFSHRRYQETLFVRYLAQHPGHISAIDLLTDHRWREYAVTLLQMEAAEGIAELLKTATIMLRDHAKVHRQSAIVAELANRIPCLRATRCFFDWVAEPATFLLGLLEEGLMSRLTEVPMYLSSAVSAFLTIRWRDGDVEDRRNVIKYGGLLPQHQLRTFLTEAFESGTRQMGANAFAKAPFLKKNAAAIAQHVRRKMASEALSSDSEQSMLRLEALAARLPEAIGARSVLRRAKLLKRLWAPYVFTQKLLLWLPLSLLDRLNLNGILKRAQPILLVGPLLVFPAIGMMGSVTILLEGGLHRSLVQSVLAVASAGFLIFNVVIALLIMIMTSGPFGIHALVRGAKQFFKRRAWWIGILSVAALFAVILGLGYLGIWALHVFGYKNAMPTPFIVGVSIVYFFSLTAGVGLVMYQVVKRQLQLHTLSRLRKLGYSDFDLLMEAQSTDQFITWLNKGKQLFKDVPLARSLSSALLAAGTTREFDCADQVKFWFWPNPGDSIAVRRVQTLLANRIIAGIRQKVSNE